MLLLIVTIVLLIFVVYTYVREKYNFWKKRNVKGPQPVFLLGNFLDVILRQFNLVDRQNSEKYGSVYGIYEGLQPVLVVSEPELLKQMWIKDFNSFVNRRKFKIEQKVLTKMMFFMEGDKWKEIRSTASPSFTSGKMKKMFPLLKECTEVLIENMKDCVEAGGVCNITDYFGAFTMDVIAKCAFAVNINSYRNTENPFVRHTKSFFSPSMLQMLCTFVFPKLGKLFGIQFMKPNDHRYFYETVTQIINKRQSMENADYHDFLQLLIDAKGSSDKNNNNNNNEDVDENDEFFAESGSNKKLDQDEIFSQCVLFFIAGYETTNTLLSFCAYSLALNPKCQELLYQEVVREMDSNWNIDYYDLMKMPYLDAVISETLRMYSPFVRIERVVEHEYEVGDTGITIPKNTSVQCPIHAIHYSPKYFPEPESFKPERFLPENRSKIIPYTFIPFGVGPRYCIGTRFALLEAKLAIVESILRFRFCVTSKTKVPPEYVKGRGLLHATDTILRLEKR